MIVKNNAPEITETTLSTYLDFALISYKDVQYQPVARNNESTKEQRIQFSEFFVENQDKLNFIYIDEVGYSISVQRKRGRSRIGTTPIQKIPIIRSANTTVCMAISKEEIILYQKKEGSFDSNSFRYFLRELIQNIERSNIQNCCLILDNSPIHKPEIVEAECSGKVHFMFLPPYSPNLNPIENIFGIIKSYMRKILATTKRDELVNTFNLPRGQKTISRQQILDETFTMASSQITHEMLSNSYTHMTKYITLALEGKDI